MKTALTFLLFSATAVLAGSGCLFCHRTTEDITVVASTEFVAQPGSAPHVSASVELIGLGPDGHATYGTHANWGDISLTSYQPGDRDGIMFFAARQIAEALIATDADLEDAEAGSLLLGQSFTLDCARNPDGCIAYDEWRGATASAIATVVPPNRSPAPLVTLEIDGEITTATGERLPIKGALLLDLVERKYFTGQTGDCS